MTARLPDGYGALASRGVRGFAHHAARVWAGEILGEGRTLAAWAAAVEGVDTARGRGTVHLVPAPAAGPDRRSRWAVRHYRRGGLIAPLLGDRYLAVGEARPLRELRAASEARARGVRTPAVVAGAWYGAGPFYRADLVTEAVPDAESLAETLFGPEPRDAAAALHAAGRAVRALEHAWVLHADLNAHNILLGRDDDSAHVIDLDRALVLPIGARRPADHLRLRLERSLRKLERESGRPLASEAWAALRAGYEVLP